MLNTYSASSVMSVSRVNTNYRPAITSSVVSGEAITVRVIFSELLSSPSYLSFSSQAVDKIITVVNKSILKNSINVRI